MRRWDFVGGIFCRIGRWWLGLVPAWPFLVRVQVIAGGSDVTDTYYPGEAFTGYGAQLEVGQGDSPTTYVAVADVMTITPGAMTTGIIEKTHLRSPGRAKEKLATLRDLGPFTITGNYRPTHGSHKRGGGDGFAEGYSLVALWRNVTEADFRIKLTDADGNTILLPFQGVVTKYQVGSVETEKKVDFTADIQPLGDWTDQLP